MINHIPIFSVHFCENIKIYDKRRIYTFIHRGAHNLHTGEKRRVVKGGWWGGGGSSERKTEIGVVSTRHGETE